MNTFYLIFHKLTMEKHIWETGILENNSPYPSPRWGQATTKVLKQMVIFGGYADSLYMNDLWSFNGETMRWTEIQTIGEKPSFRSNATMHYDLVHNSIILFGGGGQNKVRYNDIHILNWENKQWRKEQFVGNGSILWERTYHSSQLLYPYLFVFGGQAVSDLNDLWAYNIQSKYWVQIKSADTKSKPCPRRFHTSGLIDNNLYIVAGCHDKYRCLNDVFCINLTPFLTQSICLLEWNQVKLKGTSFLTRWGQSSAVFEDKIYLFGGRFSNDLQDLIVIDPLKQAIRTVKVSGQVPKGRRRHSLTFFGSSLLIFGGFNGQYFNDINFVNVFDINSKKQEFRSFSESSRGNWLNKKQLSDYQIKTKEDEFFFIHIGLIKNKFKESYQMYQFLQDINGIYTKTELLQLFQTLYIGIGNISQQLGLADYSFKLYDTEVEEDSTLKKRLCPDLPLTASLSIKTKLSSKVIHVQQSIYNSFMEQLEDQILHDLTIIVNDQYCIPANKSILASSSKYFQYLFKGKDTSEISIRIDHKMGDVRIFQAVHIFLQTGYLIVPKQIDYICWMYLTQQASYFSLCNLQAVCLQQLIAQINQRNCEQLLLFGLQNKYKILTCFCGQFLFKLLKFGTQQNRLKPSLINEEFMNDTIKYYEQMYSFELKQGLLRRKLCQNEKAHSSHNQYNQNNDPFEM